MDLISMLQQIISLLEKIAALLEQNSHKENKIIPFPEQDDRLILAAEAARILNVSKSTVYWMEDEKILTAYYTAGSKYKKFWLSEVKAVAKRRSQFN